MSTPLPIDNTFGNYSVHGIEEIARVTPVSWAPATPAWSALFVALLVLGLVCIARYYQHWKASAYRRNALQRIAELKQLHNSSSNLDPATMSETVPTILLHELPTLMKATALHASARTDAAPLTGETWLQFLDERYKGPRFQSDVGAAFLRVAYQDEKDWALNADTASKLISQCERWITKHSADEPIAHRKKNHA